MTQAQYFPGHLGIQLVEESASRYTSQLEIGDAFIAPNGYLHAGVVVTLADTTAGYGASRNLPAGCSGFTTLELKSNHLATIRRGLIVCHATPVHLGRTTQIWDASVHRQHDGKQMALFRCTQLLLYP